MASASVRGRLLRHVVAQGVWGSRPAAGVRRHRRRGDREGRRAGPAQPGLSGRRPEPPRQRGTAAAVPARNDQRHRALVPGLHRAGRGFGPGLADHDRDPRRRRVRHPRAQDLDELLRCRRLVPGAGAHRQGRAQAQGHLGVHRRHAPARDRAAAVEDDQRRHQGVRPGEFDGARVPVEQHGRRAGGGLDAGDDRRQPRTRAVDAGLLRPLRKDRCASWQARVDGAVARGAVLGVGADRDVAAARAAAAVRATRRHHARPAGVARQAADDLGRAVGRSRGAGDRRHRATKNVRRLHVQPRAERHGRHSARFRRTSSPHHRIRR